MKRNIYLMLLGVLAFSNSFGQTVEKTRLGARVKVNNTWVEIQFYTPSIVRIIKSPEGEKVNKASLSVIKSPQQQALKFNQSAKLLSVKSAQLHVTLDIATGQLTFSKTAGNVLLQEKPSGSSFTTFNDAGISTYSVSQSFQLDKDESIYGLGQQQQGKMVQRNLKLNMVQGNTDDYIPFFQSLKGYGLFWDNYSPTVFQDTPESTSFKSDVGDCIDYYFMYGGNADGVIAGMRNLTGQAPMFPLWTFGFWQSKERYKSQDEVVDVVKKYQQLGVPLDGIIQDWQYWGNNYLWNAMEFLNVEFNNPQKMVNDVHRMNAHMIISIWSSFGPQTKPYHDLDKMGALFNFSTWPQSGAEKWPPNLDYPSGVRVYDAYNPKARDVYWSYLNKGIFSLGMDGWWMDSTEPDHLDFKPHDLDSKTYLGSFRKVRNAYPLMTVGGVSEHQRAESSKKRVFILTRSAFAGQQRYGANTWSGDVTASWQALKNQISAGLNFSLCGIPYWNSDIGGFFLSRFRQRLNDPEYRELYVRWLEFGAFCPMMRSHGADAPREIYQFGKKGDEAYDAIEKYINLRYRLLPYIYSASWDVTSHQSSMMRALMMDFAADKKAIDINDEFMFGKSLLVAPVTEAMFVKPAVNGRDSLRKDDFTTVKAKQGYLPANVSWYDFWTGEKLVGGTRISKPVALDVMPLYVKAGSILPLGPKVQYAEEKRWDNLEILIYPGADGNFTLYEDENDNYHYEEGKYSEIKFHWDDKRHQLLIADRKGSFTNMLDKRSFKIRVAPAMVDGSANKERVVSYSGKAQVVKL
ncbi:TIM-barrel domain-containing protein [Mucilaginibacter sp. PAMB04274]|uniref:glycoside hydrolase family 31 protein n=1 Tax=Mucilaginibacter sp. PAMB04274 TaxID=3138568 RepID=UPI0031F6621E